MLTTLVENSLSDYLRLLKPYVSPQLISSETWTNIDAVARVLPSAITSFFGFECRLGIDEAHADFLIAADAAEAGRKILGDESYSLSLPSFLRESSVWRQINNFSRHWNTETSPLYEKIHNFWLEFDINGSLSPIPTPSCFFGSQHIYANPLERTEQGEEFAYPHQWVTQSALKLLLDKSLSPQVERQLFKCFDLLPPGAYVFQVGVMLARQSELVRICIRDISPEQILDYLTQINWLGSTRELKTLLNQLSGCVERIDLDLDVGEVVLPKIGLECYLHVQPKFEPRWKLFLDYLVERGLCVPQKRDALLAYPGYIREKSNQDLWPKHLLQLSKLLGPQYERIFFKALHHIKVVYQSDKPVEAKAYLSVNHSLMSPQMVNQWKELQEASVQIDNFLTEDEQNRLLDYVLKHESEFEPTSVYINAEETSAQDKHNRQSLILHDFPEFSDLIVERLHAIFPEVLKKLGLPPFSIAYIETQLTAHNDNHYFKLHNDNGSKSTAARNLTYVYYFNREPKAFTGGELQIHLTKIKNNLYYTESVKTIEPRNNSIVFFPSHYMHEVLRISCPSKAFADSRFTINGWIYRKDT